MFVSFRFHLYRQILPLLPTTTSKFTLSRNLVPSKSNYKWINSILTSTEVMTTIQIISDLCKLFILIFTFYLFLYWINKFFQKQSVSTSMISSNQIYLVFKLITHRESLNRFILSTRECVYSMRNWLRSSCFVWSEAFLHHRWTISSHSSRNAISLLPSNWILLAYLTMDRHWNDKRDIYIDCIVQGARTHITHVDAHPMSGFSQRSRLSNSIFQ